MTIPGIPRYSPATLRVRVWETTAGSYENAVASGRYYGEFATGQPDNNLFIPALGPPPGGPLPDPDLSGIQPLTLVPEPSVWTLLAFGALACLCARRRRLYPAAEEKGCPSRREPFGTNVHRST